MRYALGTVWMLLFAHTGALAQDRSTESRDVVVNEIRALIREHNAAALKRDREALERLYAPGFVAIHAYGYVDDRDTVIEDVLVSDPPFQIPEWTTPPEGSVFSVYGDVAVLRILGKAAYGEPSMATIIYVKSGGRWQWQQQQGTEMVRTAPPVSLDATKLEALVGRYKTALAAPGRVTVISMEAGKLTLRTPGFAMRRLTPTSETEFFDSSAGVWTFHRGPDGKVTHVVIRRHGVDTTLEKIE